MYLPVKPSEIVSAIQSGDDDKTCELLDEYFSHSSLERFVMHVNDSKENLSYVLHDEGIQKLTSETDAGLLEWLKEWEGTENIVQSVPDYLFDEFQELADSAHTYMNLRDEHAYACSAALRYGCIKSAERIWEQLKDFEKEEEFEHYNFSTGEDFGSDIIVQTYEITPNDTKIQVLDSIDRFLTLPSVSDHLAQHGDSDAIQQGIYSANGIDDMCADFAKHVIFPAFLLSLPDKEAEINNLNKYSVYKSYFTSAAFDALCTDKQDITLPLRLCESWKQAVNSFPANLAPLKPNHEWHALLPDDNAFIASNSYTISCLTNSSAVKDYAYDTHNCLAQQNYDTECSNEKM